MLLRAVKLILIVVAAVLLLSFVIVTALLERPGRVIPQVIGPLLGVMSLLILWNAVAVLVQRRRVSAVMNSIEQAVRLNLPLPGVVRAIGENSGRGLARTMEQVRQSLGQGRPLAVALSALPQMPRRLLGLIASAERVGRLPQVLGRVMAQQRAAMVRGAGWLRFYRTYPLLLAMAVVSITSIMMVFVMPKFEQIFRDFRTPLPWMTVMTLEIARMADGWSALALVLVVALLMLLVHAVTVQCGGLSIALTATPGQWVADRLPWVGRVRMWRALGELLEFTADAVDAGRPIEESLAEAAHLCPNSRLRKKIGHWISAMSQGRTLSEGARDAGLPALVCGMLSTAVDTPDLARVLNFLGRYYAGRFSRAMALLEAAVGPLISVTMGLVVGWLALSLFLPMVRLIETVGPYPTGL